MGLLLHPVGYFAINSHQKCGASLVSLGRVEKGAWRLVNTLCLFVDHFLEEGDDLAGALLVFAQGGEPAV